MTPEYAATTARLAEGQMAQTLVSDLGRVEAVLDEILQSECVTVEAVGRELFLAGGKRLRPLLLTLSARACGLDDLPPAVIQAAAAAELIHMATLIHDDVVDETPLRRGRPTAYASFGSTSAILSGDVMLAKAMELLALTGSIETIRVMSGAVVAMAQGEVREVEVRGDFELSEEMHLEILRLKTAEFMAACCQVGAILAGGAAAQCEALAGYGRHLGIAFQIVDDLLDYAGKATETGKRRGTDLIEGCATLPLILLRDRCDAEESAFVESLFGTEPDEVSLERLLALMDSKSVFAAAEAAAKEHVRLAIAHLDRLPTNEATQLLREATDLVLSRKS